MVASGKENQEGTFPAIWPVIPLCPFADFLQGKWAKMGYLAKYCSVLPHFCCSDIYIEMKIIHIKMTQIRSLGGEI